MFQIDLKRVANEIVRTMLVGKGRDEEALHLHFDVNMYVRHRREEIIQRRGIHLLYHLRAGYSYVTVFSGVTDKFFDGADKVAWEYEGCHDSCWRDIRVINGTYFSMAESINQTLEKMGAKKPMAPRDMECNVFFPGIRPIHSASKPFICFRRGAKTCRLESHSSGFSITVQRWLIRCHRRNRFAISIGAEVFMVLPGTVVESSEVPTLRVAALSDS